MIVRKLLFNKCDDILERVTNVDVCYANDLDAFVGEEDCSLVVVFNVERFEVSIPINLHNKSQLRTVEVYYI